MIVLIVLKLKRVLIHFGQKIKFPITLDHNKNVDLALSVNLIFY